MSNVNHKSAKQRISERIKAGQIVGKLNRFVMADAARDLEGNTTEEFRQAYMTSTQINAAFRLLNKVVPDLKQVEHKGDLKTQITHITQTIVEPDEPDDPSS